MHHLTLTRLAVALALCPALAAQTPKTPAQLKIDTTKIVSPVSPTLYGMMTEEINHAFDGGLYAELLSNRTFRPTFFGIEHWELVRNGNAKGEIKLDRTSGPSTALTGSVKLTAESAAPGSEAGLSNVGYWGIPLHPHTAYKGSFYAKTDDAVIGPVTARLVNDKTGATVAEAHVAVKSGPWSKYEYTLTTGAIAPSQTNHFELTVAQAGTINFQLASLMPPTYKNTPNGNRPDLMEKMAGLHPTFLRLPGGNYLEGDRLEDWYNWKKTIGPLVDRPGHQAPWTYWSTDGLGLLEFLEWCEDLKIEPVLAVYAGYALRHEYIKPGKDLEPFVQSAIDEVEYVTGDTTTKWGAERAKDGHPAPFPLHYIEIGNEDWFDRSGSYDARFAQFAKALRKAYPQYKLIATAPTTKSGDDAQPDLLDDHYYKPPAEMMDFVHHYDTQSRTAGPKIFVGEWASMGGSPTPNFGSALGDAAFMTSLERNSDLILMASYAPLLVNVNPGGMQWSPDLIGYDALTSYVSPSYYAQSLFAGHLGDGTPESSLTGADSNARFFYSATVDSKTHILHLKLVNASNTEQPLTLDLTGAKAGEATLTSLHGGSYEATNTLADPDQIVPKKSIEHITSGTWHHTVPALTIQILDIPVK
jgi:alpha-N-arabinofuranosidase